ncbi:XdhC family protein [Psychrobacter sp. AOP22-C1-C5]|uniref:XdhC family protein n=1 Tax=Psychrobacter sp. AOP22-C1-C5 TaxID=3457716 RepID=UPI00403716C5
MNQIADILKLASEAQQQNVDAVLATVVRIEGSAYRRAGAMMLICEDGRSVGMISGGCLEPHIIKRAFWLTRDGANVQVYQTGDDIEYTKNGEAKEANQSDKEPNHSKDSIELLDANVATDLNDDFENDFEDDAYGELDELNFGLGCNGRVHVLFERVATAKPLLEIIRQVRHTQQPLTIATLIRADGGRLLPDLHIGMRINLDDYTHSGQVADIAHSELAISSSEASSTFTNMIDALTEQEMSDKNAEYVVLRDADVSTEWLVQRLQPQIRLLICGAGNDVMPLVTMAKLQDWHVTVIDSRAQYATRMRFPQADAVIPLPLDSTEKLLKLSSNAAVALMSHSLSQDRARLATLLEHPNNYRYIGQLGPRYRTERLIQEIGAIKDDPATIAEGINKMHFPIGYKLGGDGPEALALGIIAQINAVMYDQTPPVGFTDTDLSNTVTTSSDMTMSLV